MTVFSFIEFSKCEELVETNDNLEENPTDVQSADDCVDISDHCSPRLCGQWSQALIKCKRTCHPQCTIRCLRNGQCQTTKATTTPVQTTSSMSTIIYTTTTPTTSTTTKTTQTSSPDMRCKCFEPKSGRSFVENSIYKHPTRPGCVTTYICASQCSKIYHLPETCSKITTTTSTTTTKATTRTTTRRTTITIRTTTTKRTTKRTTTEETLPTIRPVTDSNSVTPFIPTACTWEGDTIQIGLYKMINNCEYVQCLRDFTLNKPFLHHKAGFHLMKILRDRSKFSKFRNDFGVENIKIIEIRTVHTGP